MLNLKRTKVINNNLLQQTRKTVNNLNKNSSFLSRNISFISTNINSRNIYSSIMNKKINPFSIFRKNNFIKISESNKNFSTLKNTIQNPNNNTSINNNKKSLSNENICFLKKLDNFRNNGVEYKVYNTECIFQTIWSDFAYVSYLNERKTFNNNLDKNNIDFIRTDDDSYTIFQDESAFIDFEEEKITKTESYSYETQNENSSKFQNFCFENLEEKNHSKTTTDNKHRDQHTLITRIPQEFNISLNTNKSVKILNMGDSKLLADKLVKINLTHFANNEQQENNQNSEQRAVVDLEMRRVRSNIISITAEKGFKVKLTARSYLEAEILKISIPDESNFRVKKIGVAKNGKIKLRDAQIDIRAVFSPNKHLNTNDKAPESLICENDTQSANANYLEFSCENSNLNIGSLQGNNYFDLNSCNLIIDNVDCDNFILKSSNTKSIEIFLNSLEKLEENNFFYLNFTEETNYSKEHSNENNNDENDDDDQNTINSKLSNESTNMKISSNGGFDCVKNKKIYLNQEHKNDMVIIYIDSAALKLLKNLDKESSNEFSFDAADFQNKIFYILHGESNLLSLLSANNRNLYDIDQIKRSYVQFLKEISNTKDSILSKLKENSLFSCLDIVENDSAENLMLINYYFFNVLLKNIPNSFRIVFVDAKNIESFEIKDITAWDITKKRIQNKINIAQKRVNY